mgnify:CR=1 FL=1
MKTKMLASILLFKWNMLTWENASICPLILSVTSGLLVYENPKCRLDQKSALQLQKRFGEATVRHNIFKLFGYNCRKWETVNKHITRFQTIHTGSGNPRWLCSWNDKFEFSWINLLISSECFRVGSWTWGVMPLSSSFSIIEILMCQI